jgi:hypothetical protein
MEEAVRQKIDGRLTTQLIRETYFKTKKRMNLQEGVMRGRHYGTSWKRANPQEKVLYEMIRKGKKDKKLAEGKEEPQNDENYELNFPINEDL